MRKPKRNALSGSSSKIRDKKSEIRKQFLTESIGTVSENSDLSRREPSLFVCRYFFCDEPIEFRYNQVRRSSTLFRPDREGEKLRTPADPESGSRLTWMTEESLLSGQVSVVSEQYE